MTELINIFDDTLFRTLSKIEPVLFDLRLFEEERLNDFFAWEALRNDV